VLHTGSEIRKILIPNPRSGPPGVKKAPDPVSVFATLIHAATFLLPTQKYNFFTRTEIYFPVVDGNILEEVLPLPFRGHVDDPNAGRSACTDGWVAQCDMSRRDRTGSCQTALIQKQA
jgi:hypothetical protein